MSLSGLTILRGLVSMPILAGTGFVAMSLGLLPLDPQLEAIAKLFIGDSFPLMSFLGILGAAKIAAALSFWGYGPLPHDVAVLGMSLPAFCAIYGHYVVDGPLQTLPPIIYLGLLVTYYFLSPSDASSTTPKKRE